MRGQAVRDLPRNCGLIQRQNAQLRQIQIDLSVAWSTYPAVNTLPEQYESKTQEYAAEQANRGVHWQTWTVGEHRGFGAVNDQYIAVAHGGGQAGFLDPLQHHFVEPAVRIYVALQGVVVDHLTGLIRRDLLLLGLCFGQ